MTSISVPRPLKAAFANRPLPGIARAVLLARAQLALNLRALALAILTLTALTLAAPSAGHAASHLRWASKSFSSDSDAVEIWKLRGVDAQDRPITIRLSLANAGHRDGDLQVAVRVPTAKGELALLRNYKSGAFRATTGKFNVAGPGLQMHMVGDVIHVEFSAPQGTVKGTIEVGGGLTLTSKHDDGVIERELVAPFAKVDLNVKPATGEAVTVAGPAFIVRDASNVPAHQVFDRSVQVLHIDPKSTAMLDVTTLSASRGGKRLGFVVLRSGTGRFVGKVSGERVLTQKPDSQTGYQVPWSLVVDANGAAGNATFQVDAKRQIRRTDELAKLPYLVRKAVGLMFKPYSFELDASFVARGPGGVQVQSRSELRYSQSR